jgi:hypothetical protein
MAALWKGYDTPQRSPFAAKSCRHCQREIAGQYIQEPSGPFNGGLPFYSHPECHSRAMAGNY